MHKEANLTLTLSRSRSTLDHYLNKLGSPHIPNTTIPSPKVISLLVLEKKISKGFSPYMGKVAILVMWPKYFVQILANLA